LFYGNNLFLDFRLEFLLYIVYLELNDANDDDGLNLSNHCNLFLFLVVLLLLLLLWDYVKQLNLSNKVFLIVLIRNF
jgi:hypothetical protein